MTEKTYLDKTYTLTYAYGYQGSEQLPTNVSMKEVLSAYITLAGQDSRASSNFLIIDAETEEILSYHIINLFLSHFYLFQVMSIREDGTSFNSVSKSYYEACGVLDLMNDQYPHLEHYIEYVEKNWRKL